MKKIILFLLLVLNMAGITFAQSDKKYDSPYKIKLGKDLGITLGGMALSGGGLYLISSKDKLTLEELAALDKNDVNKFDRFTAGNYDPDAKAFSDIPFYGSFIAPLALLADKKIAHNAGQVLLLYTETMAITGTAYALTVGLVDRKRPLTYKNDAPLDEELQKARRSKNARNSFFAGHTAASASASFFVAKVFNDFNPDSKWRPVVWGVAAAVPAVVGYNRLKAGKHFLSDNLIGYLVGSSVGILVPQLHKKEMKGVSVVPIMGPYNGMAATLTF